MVHAVRATSSKADHCGIAESNGYSIQCGMSTKDQLLYSDVHGMAMRYAAEKRDLAESIVELRELADGHDQVLAEAAGITAGSWVAWPSTHMGYELVAAGMLIMAGGHDDKPMDCDELERWTRVGYERGHEISQGREVTRGAAKHLLDKGSTDPRDIFHPRGSCARLAY
jgi:hypothetical protein